MLLAYRYWIVVSFAHEMRRSGSTLPKFVLQRGWNSIAGGDGEAKLVGWADHRDSEGSCLGSLQVLEDSRRIHLIDF